MKKRIVKKYKLKESVKGMLMLGVLGLIIIITLTIQTIRVEQLENNDNTRNESVNVQIVNK